MSNQSKIIEDDWEFLASLELYQTSDGVKGVCKTMDDEEAEVVDVPPHLAAQVPMAISMMRNGI